MLNYETPRRVDYYVSNHELLFRGDIVATRTVGFDFVDANGI